MTTPNELRDLAERVEALTGPDRDIDLKIWRIVGPANASFVLDQGRKPLPWLHRFTASLDAAMSLVPEGWWLEIKGPPPNYWSAFLSSYSHEEEDAMGWGATPAIALVAAALRALASQKDQTHG